MLVYDKKHEISWRTYTYESVYILFIRFDRLLDTGCINEVSARDKKHDMFTRKRGACFNCYQLKWIDAKWICVEAIYLFTRNLKIKLK